MSIQIQIRRDDTANWESKNPILAEGEIGYDLTENRFKVGDGTSAWMDVEYGGGTGYTNGNGLVLTDGTKFEMSGSYDGDFTATGNVTAYSDARLKSDVETLDGSKVYEMRGVSFTKDGEAGSGVVAQELQKVAPELVNESGEYLSVAYGNLVGYLIEAVKELKAEVEELKGAK